jgi:periplasmic protein TonB
VALILDLAVPSGRLPSRPNRPLVGAASLSLVLHLVLVSLALLAWASRGSGQLAVSQLLSAEKLIWVGDSASGRPRGGPPQQLETRRESSSRAAGEIARHNPPAPDSAFESALKLVVPALPEPSALSDLPGSVTSVLITDAAPAGSAGSVGGSSAGTGPGGNGGNFVGSGESGSGPGGMTQPTLIQQVQPGYTADALHARAQGIVTVEAVVNADGSVGDVRVLRTFSPSYGLDAEAVRAVKQWRFRPGSRRGRAAPMYVTIELTFSLR